MRRILPFAAALLLAGCATRAPERPNENAGAPPPAPVKQTLSADLMGATAGELIRAFGTPALQIREGAGLKMQFRGRGCILDAYLYPTSQGERVTYVDARTPSGSATDGAQCAMSLSRL